MTDLGDLTDLDQLRAELDDFAQPERKGGRTPREERIIAGFEEIQRFFERQGHPPERGEKNDIFERLYAVRLDRLCTLEECWTLLAPLDNYGLLSGADLPQTEAAESMDNDELLTELENAEDHCGITELRHVRSMAEIRVAQEIANRQTCKDFERFQPLFEKVERELKLGQRQARPFGKDASINKCDFFILGGQIVYVAEIGESFKTPNGKPDARLRAIYTNGTESNLLLRSLQRALYKDETGRRLTEPDAGPLFSQTWEKDDIGSGIIYVLRSLSNHPFIAEHRELIHKIGVTSGKVETRLANVEHNPTYLLAEVEIVATYKLTGINHIKLENLFHRIFSAAQLDLTINDRFGHPVRPREWFLVPLQVIDEAVQRIIDGSITDMVYDPNIAKLVG